MAKYNGNGNLVRYVPRSQPPRFSLKISQQDKAKAQDFANTVFGDRTRTSTPEELGSWLNEKYAEKGDRNFNYVLGCIEAFLLTTHPSSRIHTQGPRFSGKTLRVTKSDPITVMKGTLTKAIKEYPWAKKHRKKIDRIRSSASALSQKL